jgi:lipopolysaccharide transport system permease protein
MNQASLTTDIRSSDFVVTNVPGGRWALPSVKELWQYRSLLVQMVISEVKVRYKQTILGVLWAVINPLITMVVFTFVFNRLAGVETTGIPYPIFVYSGLVAWQLFAKGLAASSTSVVSSGGIIGKVYFPRIFAPLSKLFNGFIDFAIAFGILLLFMLFYGYLPTLRALAVIGFVILALMTALGLGLWFSAFHVRFRDVGQLVPFFIQTLLYLSPVAYPSALLNEPLRTLYGINPMVTVCDGFRWALLDTPTVSTPFDTLIIQSGYVFNNEIVTLYPSTMIVSFVVATTLFVSGLLIFGRMEKSFPDLI